MNLRKKRIISSEKIRNSGNSEIHLFITAILVINKLNAKTYVEILYIHTWSIQCRTFEEIIFESCWIKPNLDCNYHFPIVLAPIRILIGDLSENMHGEIKYPELPNTHVFNITIPWEKLYPENDRPNLVFAILVNWHIFETEMFSSQYKHRTVHDIFNKWFYETIYLFLYEIQCLSIILCYIE